jgi:glycosyltransferase involved in cell wall biosynthesis
MKVHANVMIKNEELLLSQVLPMWEKYQIDEWVFYDDNSTDNTVELIKDTFGDKATVFNDRLPKFHESHNRSRMFEHSRDSKADFAIAIDADELMSASLVKNFEKILQMNKKRNIMYYWYNVVGGLQHYRRDPLYRENHRVFIIPVENAGKFNMSDYKYHTPRTPPVSLQPALMKDAGFIHLQSINKRFYALKQLWYKHYEHKEYGHTIEQINSRYDPVVNGLNFMEEKTPEFIIDGIKFDPSVYDRLADTKGYKEYILDNKVNNLVTFGKEYL